MLVVPIVLAHFLVAVIHTQGLHGGDDDAYLVGKVYGASAGDVRNVEHGHPVLAKCVVQCLPVRMG